MSLIVGHTSDIETDEVEFINPDKGGHLFGFESTRKFWSELRFGGLKFLPKLTEDNIHIKEDDFPQFELELNTAIKLMDQKEQEFWSFRFNNARCVMDYIRANARNRMLFIG